MACFTSTKALTLRQNETSTWKVPYSPLLSVLYIKQNYVSLLKKKKVCTTQWYLIKLMVDYFVAVGCCVIWGYI